MENLFYRFTYIFGSIILFSLAVFVLVTGVLFLSPFITLIEGYFSTMPVYNAGPIIGLFPVLYLVTIMAITGVMFMKAWEYVYEGIMPETKEIE